MLNTAPKTLIEL